MEHYRKKEVYITDVQRRLDTVEQSNEKREERIANLEKNSAVISERVDIILESLNEIKDELKKLSERPTNLLWGAIAVAMGVIITYVINNILI